MQTPFGCIALQVLAHELQKEGVKTGPCLLFRQLRRLGVLKHNNLPEQKYVRQGWFIVKEALASYPVIGETPYCRAFVTPSGKREITQLLTQGKQ